MSRKTLIILGVVLLAVLAAGGWYFLAGSGDAATGVRPTARAMKSPPRTTP